MAELRDVIRRLKLGHGVRDIHRSTGVHRTVVRQLRDLALELGWLEADQELPSEQQIEQARHRVEQQAGAGAPLFERLAAHEEEFQRWHKEKCTAVVMHDLIRKRVPCSLSTVDRYLRSRFPKPVHPVSRRDTVPGRSWRWISDTWASATIRTPDAIGAPGCFRAACPTLAEPGGNAASTRSSRPSSCATSTPWSSLPEWWIG